MEDVIITEIISILRAIWPTIIITLVVAISIRLAYLINTKTKIILYKEITNLIFILYILALFYVVTSQDIATSGTNFIPFVEIFRYAFGSNLFIKNIIGNVFIFIPFGFFITYFTKSKKITIPIIITFVTSLTIETTQLLIGRVFDIDDIILNVFGGIIGFYLYKTIKNIESKLPDSLKKQLIYNIIIIGLILILITYFYFTYLKGSLYA